VRDLLKYGRYTPSIVLAEIARKYLRKGILINEVGERVIFIETKTRVAYIDSETVFNSGETYLGLYKYVKENSLRDPSLADAAVYTRCLEKKLVTGG